MMDEPTQTRKPFLQERGQYLGKSISSIVGFLLVVPLFDDLTTPSSHCAVQKCFCGILGLCGCQLRNVLHCFFSDKYDMFTITSKLKVTLKQ